MENPLATYASPIFGALPWRDIGTFMAQLREQEGLAARALEFAILTAVRSGEVRGATWAEIDLDAGLWIVPDERMKMGKDLLDKRIQLMKAWAEYCAQPVEAASVSSIASWRKAGKWTAGREGVQKRSCRDQHQNQARRVICRFGSNHDFHIPI